MAVVTPRLSADITLVDSLSDARAPTPTLTSAPTPFVGCGTFSNPGTITIPVSGGSGISSPYPSGIVLQGLGGGITKVTVAINGITHTVPADIDVLLVGPGGQNAIIMSDVGGSDNVTGVNLVLDDTATNTLPIGLFAGGLVNGTFRPTNNGECSPDNNPIDIFPAPAPSSFSEGSALSVFNGTNPNGTWNLYVFDDRGTNGVGSFSGGWSITVATDNCAGPVPTPMPTPTPGGATHFAVVAPGSVVGGFSFTVTALDESNNTVTSYAGTIHFTSSSFPQAVLPPDSGLTNGNGTFSASLKLFGSYTITATDVGNPSITGTSNCVFVNPSMTPTPTPTPTTTPTPTPTAIPTHITLVSRLSDARAFAQNLSATDDPPPHIQTDFLPANLSNSAHVSAESGEADANCTSNSSIVVDNSMGTLRVTGDGTANSYAIIIHAHASATAKLIVFGFTLTDVTYSYSLTGQLSGMENGGEWFATAKLIQGGSPIFQVDAPPAATLSETGTLPPGTYTLSIDLDAEVPFGSKGSQFPSSGNCSANFNFTLGPTPTPTPAPTPTATPTPPGTPTPTPTPTAGGVAQAINLSTRLLVGTGNSVGIGGFIVTGTSPKQVLLRGIGPSLGNFGLPNPLADPFLELRDASGALIASNDNWCSPPNDICNQIVATGAAPSNPLESAILATLDPGAYTAILSGNNGGTGLGLVEIYDLSQGSSSKLANISTRGFVGTGSDIVIAGLLLGGGSSSGPVVIRGIGPSLTTFGVPNALANPTLELRNSDGALLLSNDDWKDDPICMVCVYGLGPPNSLESAIAAVLPPGAYTALLSGVNGGTGLGLVEVYDLGSP